MLPSAAYVLTHLDVYNWGPFGGRHHAEIDIEGTAIIGQTGSGKTTLVDALMTLIAAQPRYNLASTGGHESDRDLVSYVRGVSGVGRGGDTDHIARPGKTVSAIAASFGNGNVRLTIAGIFTLEGSSRRADLDRIWLISRQEQQGLDEWLEVHHAGALLPVEKGWQSRGEYRQQQAVQLDLIAMLPVCYALRAHQLWHGRADDLARQIGFCTQRVDALSTEIGEQEVQEQALRDRYLQTGGSNVELLEEQIERQRKHCETLQRYARDYQQLTKSLALDGTLTTEAFGEGQRQAGQQKVQYEGSLAGQEGEAFAHGAKVEVSKVVASEVMESLRQVQARPGSNIPGPFQQFRSELAAHLGQPEDALPFVAEMVEVHANQAQWRGAIERAIGGHRLRLMVPPQVMKAALSWVNGRDNRLHVRLLEVKEPAQAPGSFEDGFTRKLNFKDHAYGEALRQFLTEIDRHCVASPEMLKSTPHGLTAQGLMSGKTGFFEKQDKTPLHQGWMTGFDNKDSLAELEEQLRQATAALKRHEELFELGKAAVGESRVRLGLLERLLGLQFQDIDLPAAEGDLADLQRRLIDLTDPESDTARAQQRWQDAKTLLRQRSEAWQKARMVQVTLQKDLEVAIAQRERAYRRSGEGLKAGQLALAHQHFDLSGVQQVDALEDHETEAEGRLRGHLQKLANELVRCERDLIRAMGHAKGEDTGTLSDVGTELEDVPQYLARLKILNEEALPEKLQRFQLQRFLNYLNQSSDQGVTQLLGSIENEVAIIEERIEDLNNTMRRVDFQPGRYLRLDPRRVVHESLKTLQQAQRALRSAALQDDQGESHFRALAHVVTLLREASERRTTVGARALLDPRYRLQFAVSVIERGTGAVVETRTGSQGGSGGEKEIIASYILTASLSYALCPDGGSKPLFGTIVLDEAFSKSSQAVAGRIISALREFGLHPLFVTPNKEMRLLRAHTRSAILIHRRGQQATMTSLSWEELDVLARSRQNSQDEVTG
ncbi:ATP synthase, Delta/Epsilon chain, long alpha-helix domain [Cupriavidus basilensis OR16]|uniref:ATP synthase, Delta/Epsilon chain, long alpha-helix domain n=1 Tax=Cupriavidus basilensis OR16 TaxID=1127483 RepID=H1SI96_9BURK|nr:ATP synthase, Delta/Epsilon chain, long alpha-helix domain [Cupriavidus basilensis OR16]